jgi:RNA polymerase sigma factor (sigma-70 family)
VNDDDRSDAVLLAAAAAGEDAAFALLVRRYIRRATLLAAQHLGNRNEAEDIVQDAFTVVYKNAPRFDAARPFAPWLFGIVRQLADKRRARDWRRMRLLRLWHRSGDRQSAASRGEAPLVANLDAATAQRVMETLSPMQRSCFELVAIQGLSTEDVAVMYDISESTVRQHVFRARAVLRGVLGSTNGEGNES